MGFGDTAFAEAIVVSSSGTSLPVGQTKSGATGPPVPSGGCVLTADTSTGVLHALSQSYGAVVARTAVGVVPHFASPAPISNQLFVGTDGGAVGISGG